LLLGKRLRDVGPITHVLSTHDSFRPLVWSKLHSFGQVVESGQRAPRLIAGVEHDDVRHNRRG
jgi:hypothetical protein